MFQKAKTEDLRRVRDFYWNLIDEMKYENEKIGWKKGMYPTDEYLQDSILNGELYLLTNESGLCACVILNSACNEGYSDIPWRLGCPSDEVLIPHALAVSPAMQGRGIGTKLVHEIIRKAKSEGKKAVRLDILGTNEAAERLYIKCGFEFTAAKQLFYEDTGWTEYKMFELAL